jgi:TrmH family RNA methyltransferase
MGAFMRVQLVYTSLEELLAKQSVPLVYGAVLNGSNLYQEKLKNGLIVIGNEANGISEENLTKINKKLTIPAAKNSVTESLNAAVASSIIASEFFRQLRL